LDHRPLRLLRCPSMNCAIGPALAVAAIVSGLVGCRDAPAESSPAASDRSATEPTRTRPPRPPGDAERSGGDAPANGEPVTPAIALDRSTRDLLRHLSEDRALRARPISKRTLSLRLSLEDGPRAAFKPLLSEQRTARFEVAAFRVSRLLGLSFVPPSTMRRIPVDNFEAAIAQIRQLGEVTRLVGESVDVTEQYYEEGADIREKADREQWLMDRLQNATTERERQQLKHQIAQLRREMEQEKAILGRLAEQTHWPVLELTLTEASSPGEFLSRTLGGSVKALAWVGATAIIWVPLVILLTLFWRRLTPKAPSE